VSPNPEPDAFRSEESVGWRRRLFWLPDLVAAVVVFGFLALLWSRRAHLASVLEISLQEIAILCGVVGLTWVVVAAQNYLLYRASGIQVGFWECVVLMAGSGFGNYLPMRLGTVVRAQYLKSVHGFRYARFGSAFGVRTVLLVGATGILGLVGAIGIGLAGGRWSVELLLVFTSLLLVPLMAWVTPLPGPARGVGRVRRILGDFAEGIRSLRQRPWTSLAVLVLIVLQQVTLAARFAVAAAATGSDPPLAVLLLLAPLAVLTAYLSVTPGGLGVREAVMGYATYASGASFSSGLYVGTVDRAIQLAMVAALGGASFAFMWWRSRRTASPRS
jgi:uncharacterized membrane protein YbhN (UPF0104 family)